MGIVWHICLRPPLQGQQHHLLLRLVCAHKSVRALLLMQAAGSRMHVRARGLAIPSQQRGKEPAQLAAALCQPHGAHGPACTQT